jgi:hypothetical protein
LLRQPALISPNGLLFVASGDGSKEHNSKQQHQRNRSNGERERWYWR